MKRLFVACALLAACQSTKAPTGYGVNLTISARGLADVARTSITELRIVVDAESYDKTVDVRTAIGSGEVRMRYRPALPSGTLVFRIDALAAGALVARVISPEVPLVAGRATDVPLALEGVTLADVDLAGADIATADAAEAPDLRPACETTCTAPCMGCNAAGECVPSVGTVCKAAVCNPDNTFVGDSTCNAQAQCVAPAPVSNNCLSKKANGVDCGDGAECQTGKCVDGVCCDGDCTSTCMSCNLASKPGDKGKCTYVPAGEMPTRGTMCPAGSGNDSVCTPGGCDGSAARCAQASVATVCRGATCDVPTRMAIAIAYCSVAGTCAVPSAAACGGYYCNGTACATGCGTDGDCASGYYCNGVNCLAKKDQGADCSAFGNKECKNNICADGYCCNSACSGACERCNGTVKGTCSFVTSDLAFHGTCTGQASPATTCGGRCNGSQSGCFYPTVQCQAASCYCNPRFAGVPAGCFFKLAVSCASGSCATTADALCPDNFACNGTSCHTKPCDNTAGNECYEGTTCKQHINPALNFCAP